MKRSRRSTLSRRYGRNWLGRWYARVQRDIRDADNTRFVAGRTVGPLADRFNRGDL